MRSEILCTIVPRRQEKRKEASEQIFFTKLPKRVQRDDARVGKLFVIPSTDLNINSIKSKCLRRGGNYSQVQQKEKVSTHLFCLGVLSLILSWYLPIPTSMIPWFSKNLLLAQQNNNMYFRYNVNCLSASCNYVDMHFFVSLFFSVSFVLLICNQVVCTSSSLSFMQSRIHEGVISLLECRKCQEALFQGT